MAALTVDASLGAALTLMDTKLNDAFAEGVIGGAAFEPLDGYDPTYEASLLALLRKAYILAAAALGSAAPISAPEAWHTVGDPGEPAFEGTWVNEGTPFQDMQFRLEGDRVRLRGVVQSGGSGSAIFTLPAGYWPPADIKFCFNGTTAAVIHAVTITAAGVVQHVSGASTAQLGIGCEFSITP